MNKFELYEKFRSQFPDIAAQADNEYNQIWYDEKTLSPFIWFESVATVINTKMRLKTEASELCKLFEFFRKEYLTGNDVNKKCIDVAVIENLFWKVDSISAETYWRHLPTVLQELYVEFHQKEPY